MAQWTMFLLVVAVLSITVGGLSLDPQDYDLIDGASASAERLRQGSSLAEYMLNDGTCTATCNNETYTADTDCEGAFLMRCSGTNKTEEFDITYYTLIECLGHWSSSGWNESDWTSKEGEVLCNGAFHEKSVAMLTHANKTYFIVSRFSCAFMFSYETTYMGGSKIDSSTCHGAAGYDVVQSDPEEAAGVTEEFLEELLDGVSASFGPVDLQLHPDAMSHSGLSSPPMKPVFSARCNGEEAPIFKPCHGTLDIAVETKNMSIAEECRGWWMPIPGPRVVFTCTGAWTVGVSTNAGEHESDLSCVGHAALSWFRLKFHDHNFTGSRILCVGRQDTSSQTQSLRAFMNMKPLIEETDTPAYVS